MNKKSAFSLIELSIVILIVGIIIAGVAQSSRLVRAMKMTTARSLVKSSPVASIPGLVLWFETVSEDAIVEAARQDGTVISTGNGYVWNDINPQKTAKDVASSASGPTYIESCINSLPCLRFNGTSSYLDTVASNGASSALTFFIVFKPLATPSGTASDIFTTRDLTSGNNGFWYVIQNGSKKTYYRQNSSSTQVLSSEAVAAGSAYISYVIDDSTKSVSYLSGGTSATTNGAQGLKNLGPFSISAWSWNGTVTEYFSGDISEIIIFDRNLTGEETQSVAKYLSQKWGIAL